jgi:hypothetical protein
MTDEKWAGEERRGIPIHLLNYMDARLTEQTSKVETFLKEYVANEIDQVVNKMNVNNLASERRHDEQSARFEALSASIMNYLQKADAHLSHATPCPALKDAIPLADWKGHHDHHVDEMKWAEKLSELKWTLIKVIAGTGIVGLLGWIGVLMWAGFLQGPRP